jgi:hypothetical protein
VGVVRSIFPVQFLVRVLGSHRNTGLINSKVAAGVSAFATGLFTIAGAALLALTAASTTQAAGSAQSVRSFKARLSPVPIDIAMQATIAGSGSVTASLEGNKLTVNGTFQDLRSPATVARIHRAYRGTRGAAFADLKVSGGTSGTISGAIELTKEQIGDLGKSLFYVQLHSEKAPEGNLWGWLLSVEGKTK